MLDIKLHYFTRQILIYYVIFFNSHQAVQEIQTPSNILKRVGLNSFMLIYVKLIFI